MSVARLGPATSPRRTDVDSFLAAEDDDDATSG
jgi:hypothetical protein